MGIALPYYTTYRHHSKPLPCNHSVSLFPMVTPFKRHGSISHFLSGLINRGQLCRPCHLISNPRFPSGPSATAQGPNTKQLLCTRTLMYTSCSSKWSICTVVICLYSHVIHQQHYVSAISLVISDVIT